MRAVIVCTSVHHGNTERVARAMARELGAEVVPTPESTVEAVTAADLVGFGSGIYYGRHHRSLIAFAESLPMKRDGRAIVFSTPGANGTGFHRKLDDILRGRATRSPASSPARAGTPRRS